MDAEHRFQFRLHFLRSVERGLPLNLAGVDGYAGNVETGKTPDVHGIQLGSIEPPPDRRKSPSQCPMDCGFCGPAERSRRM
jgi:hypothetical protein